MSYPGEDKLLSELDKKPEHGTYPILPSIGSSQLGDDVAKLSRVENVKKELWDTVYIYSYQKDLSVNFTATTLTDNQMCLLDALKQDAPSVHGKKAILMDDEPYLTWSNEPKSAFFHDNNQPYDFYAYYLDGVTVGDSDVIKSESAIKMNITINGRNDIMSSKAEITAEQLNSGTFSDRDKQVVRDMSFSNITAAWKIQPVFQFKHHLCKFVFSLFPAKEDVGNVYIESISVYSKTKGVFTVASSVVGNMGVDFSQKQEYSKFDLREDDGSELRKDVYHPVTDGVDFSKPLYQRPYVKVGGDLLLPPGEMEYTFEISVKQEKNGQIVYAPPTSFVLNNKGKVFEPGNEYSVKLGVYSIQDIRPTVTVTPWVFGGNIEIDPDKGFGDMFNE